MRLSLLLLLLVLAPTPAPAESEPRRFALVVGNDDGGEGTQPLLYAQRDARRMSELLRTVGGVREEDSVLLLESNAEQFLATLGRLEQRLEAVSRAGGRTALIVYYSGHAKNGELRLGSSGVPFDALRSRLAQSAADVRLGIFDACRSGSLTRTKGVRRAPAFAIEADADRQARGIVLLTSSAADEDSQESDILGGSYFSHHLGSALRGDGDRSGDGRVSLSEAYAYAYERTVADTSTSESGAQHPTFSYDLKGNGDFVLSDLKDQRTGLLFPAPTPAGVYFVMDARGFIAAEVVKPEREERRIVLAAGRYRLQRRGEQALRVGEVEIRANALTSVEEKALRDAPFSDDWTKGAGVNTRWRPRWTLLLSGGYQSFVDGPGRLFPSSGLIGVEAYRRHFFGRGWGLSLDASVGGRQSVLSTTTLESPYRYGTVTAGASVVAEWTHPHWTPFVGARLAFLHLSRTFEGDILPKEQSYYALTPGLLAGLRYRFGSGITVGLRARGHYLLYRMEEDRSLAYWELGSLLGYEL